MVDVQLMHADAHRQAALGLQALELCEMVVLRLHAVEAFQLPAHPFRPSLPWSYDAFTWFMMVYPRVLMVSDIVTPVMLCLR